MPYQSWEDSKRQSDHYTPALKHILTSVFGQYPVYVASRHADQRQNTDLIIYAPYGPIAIAARVRAYRPYFQYKSQITIRSVRQSGGCTELSKLMRGYGDFILYAHASQAGYDIDSWILGDLDSLRCYIRQSLLATGSLPGHWVDNRDGTAFIALDLDQLPDGFVVASHGL